MQHAQAMATRAALERQAQAWLDEAGVTPPGNGVEKRAWEPEGASASAAAAAAASATGSTDGMTPAERLEHEERKLKLRKAMGESLAAGDAGESDDARTRREKLMNALQNDDWSAVINDQQGVAPPVVGGAGAAAADSPVVSPFSRAGVHRAIGNDKQPHFMELTRDNVDAVLDEARALPGHACGCRGAERRPKCVAFRAACRRASFGDRRLITCQHCQP